MPACTECRRRKLGCSKELPSCKECRRLGTECVYGVKEKPGIKSGAVENLNRRVDKIELLLRHLQEQTSSIEHKYIGLDSNPSWRNNNRSPQTASELLTLFEREMREFKATSRGDMSASPEDLSPSIEAPKTTRQLEDLSFTNPAKRKRLNSTRPFNWGEVMFNTESRILEYNLSPAELLDAVLYSYFTQIHPWLPILHENNFREIFSKQSHCESIEVVLHAVIVSAVKFVRMDSTPNGSGEKPFEKTSRDWVMLHAMNSLSVSNLQALLIIAFNDIGNGDVGKAWSIIGSLTRTVEYVQLSVEIEEDDEQPLLRPCSLLPLHKDWTEMETRRRVFWNVFNLDRFCSVVTGWNTSLTSDDVHRRLPVDGVLWRKQEPILAPYFGIWDKSAGRIGNPITFLPTNETYQTPIMASDLDNDTQTEGMSCVGAFAYAIEATESMSRVTTYFLQQKVNLQDPKQIGKWLTRFKELDLRLVHWKMLLPQKWKDTNISRQSTEMMMDPNLTLAHITHNASMILLHQLIAYPPAGWDWANRLPSRCSADTCQIAAVETSSITENYLKSPTKSKIVNGQFLFCVFIAARVLLVHWRYYGDADPLSEFPKLVSCLESFSTRWNALSNMCSGTRFNLAAKYANLLRNIYEKCTKETGFRISVLDYPKELADTMRPESEQYSIDSDTKASLKPPGNPKTALKIRQRSKEGVFNVQAPEESFGFKDTNETAPIRRTTPSDKTLTAGSDESKSLSSAETRTSRIAGESQVQQIHSATSTINLVSGQISDDVSQTMNVPSNITTPPLNEFAVDDLTSVSQMLLDQQFMDMDRVITYDQGMFTANMGWWDQES